MVAWYILSNESYMKRVINDVLPTAIDSAKLRGSLDNRIVVEELYHSVRLGRPV